jgi:AcrR family transcriptional regulator
MEARTRQMAERRERILAAAREVVAEQGYAGLSMRDLAQKSRVTVPTIYNLIGGKDAVLLAAVEEQTARFVAGIEETRGAVATDHIVAVHDSCVRELLRLPRYYRSFLLQLVTSEAAAPIRSRVGQALVRELGRGVEALRAAGALAEWVEPATLTALLHGHLNVVSLQWASGDLPDARLRAAALYGSCCVLAGACRGESRELFAARAAEHQASLGSRRGAGRRRA